MAITSLDSKGISEFASSQANLVVESVKQRATGEAEMILNGLKYDYFEMLTDKSDLKSALSSLFADKRCKGFRPNENLAKLIELVDKDQITKGTRVVRIDKVSDTNPRTYLVLSEQGRKIIRIQVDSSDEPDGRLQHKSSYISESLFLHLASVFEDVINQYVKESTSAEFSALEKAIGERKSVFKRVLGLATSLLFGRDRLDKGYRLDNYIRDFRFNLILETFKINKSAEIPEEWLTSGKHIVVVDRKNRRIIRHASLKNYTDNGWYAVEIVLAPRGMESTANSFKITKDMTLFDPSVVFEIEEKAKQTLKSASMGFVNQLAWNIKHRKY